MDQESVAIPYKERLAAELAVICDMGFAGYFLIVQDYVIFAKNNGISVGPGRGSGQPAVSCPESIRCRVAKVGRSELVRKFPGVLLNQ